MIERKDMTVAELFELWFEENRDSIGETARRPYSFYYSQYVSRLFDGRRVKDLTADTGCRHPFTSRKANQKQKSKMRWSSFHAATS